MMKKKIKDTRFRNIPVTIYITSDNEYLLEYKDKEDTVTHNCGYNTMFWEVMSGLCGDGELPDGFTLVDLANQVESKVTYPVNEEQLNLLIREVVEAHCELLPAYIAQEILEAVKQRLMLTPEGYVVANEITIDEFLANAMRTKMIFTMSNECYSHKRVRINKIMRHNHEIYLYISFVEAEEDEDGHVYWCEDKYGIVKYDKIQLEHSKLDEFSPEYSI